MIPLSSRIHKYRKIMNKKIEKTGRCDILHIMKLDNDKESVFLIQDMFPIVEDFIERKYTINGNHLIISSEYQVESIRKNKKEFRHY